MRFVFLGTGTSAGVPAIGCDCGVCTSEDPRDRRLRTSGALLWTDSTGQERAVLLDAGPDLRQQTLRLGLKRCDAIFFTHNHVDHIFGLDEVRRFNALMGRPIDIYADAHTLASLRRVYQHIFDRDRNVNDSFVATLIPHTIEAGRGVELHGVRFTPFKLLHGGLPILGYRIERGTGTPPAPSSAGNADPLPLAYCTDVSGIPPESWTHLRGLRTLVLDALRHRRHPTHFTVGQAVSVAHEAGAGQTYFVHMSHDLPHEATDGELPEGMHLAYDGLTLGEGSPRPTGSDHPREEQRA